MYQNGEDYAKELGGFVFSFAWMKIFQNLFDLSITIPHIMLTPNSGFTEATADHFRCLPQLDVFTVSQRMRMVEGPSL